MQYKVVYFLKYFSSLCLIVVEEVEEVEGVEGF